MSSLSPRCCSLLGIAVTRTLTFAEVASSRGDFRREFPEEAEEEVIRGRGEDGGKEGRREDGDREGRKRGGGRMGGGREGRRGKKGGRGRGRKFMKDGKEKVERMNKEETQKTK